MTIYLVEDEANIRDLVVYTLNASGFDAAGFADAAAFFDALAARRPDLVLLDIMLPGQDGLSVLKTLRGATATKTLPVIMLTAKDTEYDKVLGLDAGADDYIAKPFGMMELVSRVKAVLRRTAPADAPAELSCGPIVLLPQRRQVAVNGRPVTLTLKEFDLLQMLMEVPGYVLGRDQIMERIWGYSYEGDTRTVDVHVRSLRQKLGEGAGQLETVRGVGYRIGGAL